MSTGIRIRLKVLAALFIGSIGSVEGTSLSTAIDALTKKTLEAELSDSLRQLSKGSMRDMYALNGFKPLWIKENQQKQVVKEILKVFSQAEEEGLNPLEYEGVGNLWKLLEGQHATNPQAWLQAETALTQSLLQYISDLTIGRFDPSHVDELIALKRPEINPAAILHAGIQAPDMGKWLKTLSPNKAPYQQLKRLLATYRTLCEAGAWPELPLGIRLEKGQTSEGVAILQEQLLKLGDLPTITNTPLVFDETIERALKRFQGRHGVDADGKVGPQTLVSLNKSPKERLHQISVSMERWRWMPADLGKRYLFVNIPAFTLNYVVNGESRLKMPIVVGKTYRKTPVFSSWMKSIIFNPAWHVPHSIAVKDKLPLLRKNADSLKQAGYKVYSQGEEIDPASINWNLVSDGYFPYRLIQAPSEKNALGKIRFSIDNPYDIYLHGTPARHVFQHAKRALSSGCIRVESPIDLAEAVLNDARYWAKGKILTLSKGSTPHIIALPEPLPVHITYFTAWVDPNQGIAYFVDDIYEQDKHIWKALEKSQAI